MRSRKSLDGDGKAEPVKPTFASTEWLLHQDGLLVQSPCGACGMVADRDTNAAVNVRNRAFGPTGVGIPPAPSGARTAARQ